MKYYIV